MNKQQIQALSTLEAKALRTRLYKKVCNSALFGRIAEVAADITSWSDASFNDYEPEIAFYLSLSGLEGFGDAKLSQALRWLSAPALKLSPLEAMSESKENFSRTYKLHTLISGVRVKVHFTAYEKEEFSTCARVQVGTKTVETPVYEYKCLEVIATEVPAPVLLDNL